MSLCQRLCGIALLILATQASAAEWKPYDSAAFTALTSAGKVVVIDVHADWCPTCQRQQPVLRKLTAADKYPQLTVMVVDFDKPGDAKQRFHVAQQSTLIVFNGTHERARATGISESADIESLLNQGL